MHNIVGVPDTSRQVFPGLIYFVRRRSSIANRSRVWHAETTILQEHRTSRKCHTLGFDEWLRRCLVQVNKGKLVDIMSIVVRDSPRSVTRTKVPRSWLFCCPTVNPPTNPATSIATQDKIQMTVLASGLLRVEPLDESESGRNGLVSSSLGWLDFSESFRGISLLNSIVRLICCEIARHTLRGRESESKDLKRMSLG